MCKTRQKLKDFQQSPLTYAPGPPLLACTPALYFHPTFWPGDSLLSIASKHKLFIIHLMYWNWKLYKFWIVGRIYGGSLNLLTPPLCFFSDTGGIDDVGDCGRCTRYHLVFLLVVNVGWNSRQARNHHSRWTHLHRERYMRNEQGCLEKGVDNTAYFRWIKLCSSLFEKS